jgi:hypothetical protein
MVALGNKQIRVTLNKSQNFDGKLHTKFAVEVPTYFASNPLYLKLLTYEITPKQESSNASLTVTIAANRTLAFPAAAIPNTLALTTPVTF